MSTRRLSLTDRHLAAVPPAEGQLYDPAWRMLEDGDLDRLAAALTEGRPRPVPIFAYGSLIWNPGFPVAGRRRAVARGWHRDFTLAMTHFRATPERPGLMLALSPGGSCEGVLLEIAPGTETDSLRAILRRELVAHELARNACWIEVETERGTEPALTFYAGPVDADLARLDLPEQAQRLASAAGAAGSCAEYLLRTAEGLEAFGIHDDYIWTLQHLVAQQIEASSDFRIWVDSAAPAAKVQS